LLSWLFCAVNGQRKDTIFLTINVPNVKQDATYKLTEDGHLKFKGKGGNFGSESEYILDIDLLKAIKPDDSKVKITARNIIMKIAKANSGPYWERLLKEKGKNVHCTIDWDNWRDEDDDEEDHAFPSQFADNKDFQDMDFGSGGSSDDSEEDASELVDGTDLKPDDK
jgi:cytosolic prostaglandin-E synthase